MKLTLAVITFLTIFQQSFSNTPPTSDLLCGPHCISCYSGYCFECLNKPLIKPDNKRCQEEDGPDSDHCVTYTRNMFGSDGPCGECKEGYAKEIVGNNCIVNEAEKIENCLSYAKWFDVFFCNKCDGGIFNQITGKCMPISEMQEDYRMNNCLIGIGVFNPEKPSKRNMGCARCEEGYVWQFRDSCKKMNVPGCLSMSNDGT